MTPRPIQAMVAMLLWIFQAGFTSAQSLDDPNIQLHGYATQGFVYSTNNNWNTTNSTDGSSAITEAVVTLTAQPQSRLRIGMQARYYLLGKYGNQINLDWASADYKVNEQVGLRVGKVKTPLGLWNDIQDVDPAHVWILLPQSIYPIASRNSTLSHYGGVFYGALSLSESLGKLQYRAYAGQRRVASNDGALSSFANNGIQAPEGLAGRMFGGTLAWQLPMRGLKLGATEGSEKQSGRISAGPLQGMLVSMPFNGTRFFAQYERTKFMLAAEYSRLAPHGILVFNGIPPIGHSIDNRGYYFMTTYKLAKRLTGGLYFSGTTDRQAPFTSDRYQKDWTVSSRYDVTSYLYAKFEQHFVDGTAVGYSSSNNPDGLKPDSRMTLLKLGVSF